MEIWHSRSQQFHGILLQLWLVNVRVCHRRRFPSRGLGARKSKQRDISVGDTLQIIALCERHSIDPTYIMAVVCRGADITIWQASSWPCLLLSIKLMCFAAGVWLLLISADNEAMPLKWHDFTERKADLAGLLWRRRPPTPISSTAWSLLRPTFVLQRTPGVLLRVVCPLESSFMWFNHLISQETS